MPITDIECWDTMVEANADPYGGACIAVARRAMKILDEEPGDFECYDLICRADRDAKAGGITGFMAGCVAQLISKVHSRGEEFRCKWNTCNQIRDEGELANKSKGVLNPALLRIGKKEKES